MQLKRINEEVYYTESEYQSLGREAFDFLVETSSKNVRKRCRICTHPSPSAQMHEMFILHRKGNYVPVHLHLSSAESSLILEGEGALILYHSNGEVKDVIYLNSDTSKGYHFIRIPQRQLHSLYIESELFYFKETTCGPFERTNNVEATWTPKEHDTQGVNEFLNESRQLFQQAKLKHDS